MNDKFFQLPLEKQHRILNAAFKLFAHNSYKKTSMSQLSKEGDISKSLLFHYFKNKKELYLYLWNYSLEITRTYITEQHVLDTGDFFELLRRTLSAKCSLMRQHPHIFAFSLNAYYEQLPEIKDSIQQSYAQVSKTCENKALENIDCSTLCPNVNLKLMYEEIFYAMDGYMLRQYQSDTIEADKIVKFLY